MSWLETFRRQERFEAEEKLADKLRGFYRAWNNLEKNGVGKIIDFDLAPFSPEYSFGRQLQAGRPSRAGRAAVINILEQLIDETSKTPFSPEHKQQKEYLLPKLGASLAYARRIAGEKLNNFDYIKQVDGLIPFEIPQPELLNQMAKVIVLLKESGCSGYDAKSLINFFKSQKITDPEAIKAQIKQFGDYTLLVLGRVLDERIQVSYETQVVSANAYWVNWADGDASRFLLRVNNHPRHQLRWIKGKPAAMGSHEIGAHFGQMSIRAESIKQKKLLHIFGITTVFEPEQFAAEGIAQTLPYFLPELVFPRDAWLNLELGGLREMVYNNVHFRINSSDFSETPDEIKEIKECIWQFLPTEPEDRILKEIADRTQNPQLQAYRYVYGAGFYIHRQWAEMLSEAGKKEFLKTVFETPMTPTQEMNLFKRIWQKPHFRSKEIRGQELEKTYTPDWLFSQHF